MLNRRLWMLWLLLSIGFAGYFANAVSSETSKAKRVLLPGETTHGHYQIELACNACHSKFNGIREDACTSCHENELRQSNDTHPASKFNDPTNADRLAKLDAQKCISCHREHVPDRTHAMGLSIPGDYCFHCHDDVAEHRPSHSGMDHSSCATAGCHNYHDNRALFEKFLFENCDQPDHLNEQKVLVRNLLDTLKDFPSTDEAVQPPTSLTIEQADAPSDLLLKHVVGDWAETAHAAAGVNCRGCHDATSEDGHVTQWKNNVSYDSCRKCHEFEVSGFLLGRHGMRLAQDMTPMSPGMARAPMHPEMSHAQLDCTACHSDHRFDSAYAAVDACLKCHNDEHTKSYTSSQHYELWKSEMAGAIPAGSGVSCATCHMPRVELDGVVQVDHNQNRNLRPNEKMVRSVCMNCHGLEFSLNSLADRELIDSCFQGMPTVEIDSAQMAKRWFEEKEASRLRRIKQKNAGK